MTSKKKPGKINKKILIIYLITLLAMAMFGVWLKSIEAESSWQQTGQVTFTLGFVLLGAYLIARLMRTAGFPLISGYIVAGIIAGPYITGFLTEKAVDQLRLVDDLALSFIALAAGGSLHFNSLRKRLKAILLNIALLILVVSVLVFSFVFLFGGCFGFIKTLSSAQIMALALLLGVIAVACSPSSAIAVIDECRATGPFTEMIMGVTVAVDVLIIILFTLVLTVTKLMLSTTGVVDYSVFVALSIEITVSFIFGILLGKGLSYYIFKVGHDLPLIILVTAFAVAKASLWASQVMEQNFDISLHLDPLLICISAGFTVQNFSETGQKFFESLERISLPVYVLFFSLVGASLDLRALQITWPLAVSIAVVRITGIFCATWVAGTLNGDPPQIKSVAWMPDQIRHNGVSL